MVPQEPREGPVLRRRLPALFNEVIPDLGWRNGHLIVQEK